MSENEYSKRIKSLIEKWGEVNKDKFDFTISKILIKNTLIPLRSSGTQRLAINYRPDAIYVLDFKDKIVFEVLDSQIEEEAKTIADLVRCIFNEAVTDIVFIVKNDKSVKEVLKTSKVILDNFDNYLNLKDTEEAKRETPINANVIKITETVSKSKQKFFKIFDREMKKIIEG